MGTWGPISQRLNDMASPKVIGWKTYAQYVALPIHGRIGTINLHNATVGGLQHLLFNYEMKWNTWTPTYIYETNNEH